MLGYLKQHWAIDYNIDDNDEKQKKRGANNSLFRQKQKMPDLDIQNQLMV